MKELWVKKTIHRCYLVKDEEVEFVKSILDNVKSGKDADEAEIVIGDVYDINSEVDYDLERCSFPLEYEIKNAGDFELMNEIEKAEYSELRKKYVGKNYKDDKTNRLSQFIWRRYASSAWEDIRPQNCLSYDKARDKDDERHVCPLQLDIITRAVELYTNPGETVVTPFGGVGSEVYTSVKKGRKGVAIELKPSYFNQMVKNVSSLDSTTQDDQTSIFEDIK